MSILDTIFVKMSHRGKGYTKALINQLMNTPDILISNEEVEMTSTLTKRAHLLGFSSPISNGMLWLLIRMIVADELKHKNDCDTERLSVKEKFWLIEDENESPRNIWWSVSKLASDRGLNKHSWCL